MFKQTQKPLHLLYKTNYCIYFTDF